jgi:protein associated with RNAse G/E
MITVNSRSYDGSLRKSWTCELIERSEPLLVFVGEFSDAVDHPDLGRIEKGTLSYEYYWLDRWYNIFRFHTAGELRNYYCNISMPPSFADDVLDYIDLDIDIVVWPDFEHTVLDRDDYIANANRFGYPAEVNAKVEETLKELLELIANRDLPGASQFATSEA